MKGRIIYIPVEVKARAWTAKLKLAMKLVENGYTVVFGQRDPVLNAAIKWGNGIFIDKDIYYKRFAEFQKLKASNNVIFAFDAEGLIFLSDEWYLNERISEESLSLCDKFFCWGEYQYNLISERFGQYKDKLVIAGNPRIDLLFSDFDIVYKKELEQIRKIGRFILISDNFVHGDIDQLSTYIFNHYKGLLSDKQYNNINLTDIKNIVTMHDNVKKAFSMGIDELASQVDATIVIRTHPTIKKANIWENIAKKHSNVILRSEYDANPWIYASDILIHNNCTTGIEARIMKHKVLAYVPVTTPFQEFSNDLCDKAYCTDELINSVRTQQYKNTEIDEETNEKLHYHINFRNNEDVCNNIILEYVNDQKINETEISYSSIIGESKLLLQMIRGYLGSVVYSRPYSFSREYTSKSMYRIINAFNENKTGINIDTLGRDLFVIYV